MPGTLPALSAAQIDAFITDGFVRIDNAFPQELADQGRAILWAATGCNPDDPSTWTQPVVRLGNFTQPPFRDAANTPVLHAAYDQLVGEGHWLPQGGLGTFPVRFPSSADAGDTGWHVDASFGFDAPDFLDWRANVSSRGRALLMLFLFSDVGEDDAPTRIRVGSHLEVARYLAPAGDAGHSLRDMIADRPDWFDTGREALATGRAGTVYLCHPFLVHAAQLHRGTRVKFMAQPPLLPKVPLQIDRADGNYSPVELAIRVALDQG
ncbi:phytanoyl-CoA dioxygenase family protein [Devosia sp. SL43]|uniref:phytanoyl-CoA dioxygenase family protein n=1 Tax=Devosia sp. SL43 TaxID=2806348 RepID=UPI001F400207|nr:phytanoyl-CoA dioxygenase family protein [Devosia sp. SL43]UJW86981.1 phytanoyl-CoA dioxygenase family protein [Devosia sp. SL43]